MSRQTGDKLAGEILHTDTLLRAIGGARAPLFRFPYGARNSEGMAALAGARLKSVMWNIDSLDWADPVPSSIADRVLRAVDKEGRGIILFHDIHERTDLQGVERKIVTPPTVPSSARQLAQRANDRGFVFYKREKYAEAARWFDNTVRMAPSRAIAYLNLGDAHARAGDGAKARTAYRTYLELAPSASAAGYVKQQMERLERAPRV